MQTVQTAMIVEATEAEGPGLRFAIWVQGCPLRCRGCCNPSYLSFTGGTATRVTDLLEAIARSQKLHGIEGISLLGGEPTSQAASIAALAKGNQELGLSVTLYSGFTLAELRAKTDADIDSLLAATDILVDGPYDRMQPESRRRWVGSANQSVHFLTDRYRSTDPCWTKPNTLELRVTPSSLSINGFPSLAASGLWKGWTRRS